MKKELIINLQSKNQAQWKLEEKLNAYRQTHLESSKANQQYIWC